MLRELNFKKCYINGNIAGVQVLSDGRAVLHFNGSWLDSDGVREELQLAGVSCHSFGAAVVIPSADRTGILTVTNVSSIDWEDSPEFQARFSASRGIHKNKIVKGVKYPQNEPVPPTKERHHINAQTDSSDFQIRRLEELCTKINTFSKEDENYYFNEFLKLNALRIDDVNQESNKESYRKRISYCDFLSDYYNGICDELKSMPRFGYLVRSSYEGIISQCSCLYFASQILGYYLSCIENKKFEDIYSNTPIKNLKLDKQNQESLTRMGSPCIESKGLNAVVYLGAVFFYTKTNIENLLSEEINRIARSIKGYRKYKGLLESAMTDALKIEHEALPLLAYSKRLLHNEQFISMIERRKLEYQSYKTGNVESILRFLKHVLEDSTYPFSFNKHIELEFSEEGTLVIEYRLPVLADLPDKYYKELKRENEWVKLAASKLNTCYDDIICAMVLRTIGEIFTFDSLNIIKSIGFNGFIQSHSPATGTIEKKCILSLLVRRETFYSLNLRYIQPKECVKYLKGVFTSKIYTGTPIQPIISINKDRRIVPNKDVEYTSLTNLAEMDWEDFEHFVRQIFEWEFKDSGGEVNVTQASRDGGVDAIIFDPDPIRGGKIVVQAKRYTNTVGVSAVRDLYGTIINEGANKGILITTSDYGPDAYKFATGKPITLLNGGHLLYLLGKHGKKARIDIKEAKENLTNKQQ
ncbi:MAG: restriction endonuclease [Muribaculum sp.]|nr:restriction endonuclease [Muribaculum sp.]